MSADHDHGHDDHGHGHEEEGVYFDASTSILAPIYIIIALLIIFGTLMFG
ncbi:MAG: hypothetical protein MK078_01135 [Crocinitomicaceae bacterium]|nr:hypothetical protein [Crocinitomicaceae bacterium]